MNTDLIIEDIIVGSGEAVEKGDTVIIHYTGTLEDGTVFDSSLTRNEPFKTPIGVGYVIEGWDKGLIGMKIGGERNLIIPSDMAYGDNGISGVIPPKATLKFHLQLLDIKKKQ
jgi:FKBP-type peptidyl-prolyl cis-trans isomerase